MRTDAVKRKRQELIKEIIQTKPIMTQEELVSEIKSRHVDVTQTTISRDLDELQVGKWNGRYYVPFTGGDSPAWFQVIRNHVDQIKKTGDHLISIRTRYGSASMIEKTLADLSIPEVAGIVSSQSTVMIAFETTEQQVKFFTLLQKALQ